ADSGNAAYQAKQYARSAELYERAASVPNFPGAASAWYNAACSWALAGDRTKAVTALARALDAGWRNAAHLKTDSDLDVLHGSPEWSQIVARAEKIERDYAASRASIANVKLVTNDITNFWRAYDLAAAETSFVARQAIFQREYFDRASIGLIDYFT